MQGDKSTNIPPTLIHDLLSVVRFFIKQYGNVNIAPKIQMTFDMNAYGVPEVFTALKGHVKSLRENTVRFIVPLKFPFDLDPDKKLLNNGIHGIRTGVLNGSRKRRAPNSNSC
ncbi:hypothetical protein ACOME3_010637 [Neoechinorhynchus agilis]